MRLSSSLPLDGEGEGVEVVALRATDVAQVAPSALFHIRPPFTPIEGEGRPKYVKATITDGLAGMTWISSPPLTSRPVLA